MLLNLYYKFSNTIFSLDDLFESRVIQLYVFISNSFLYCSFIINNIIIPQMGQNVTTYSIQIENVLNNG